MKKVFLLISSIALFATCNRYEDNALAPKGATEAATSSCGTSNVSAGAYYLNVNAWGGGGYCVWYTNINSWGANASGVNSSSIVGYPSMVRGCHWSSCSSGSGLPKALSAISSVSSTWTQSASSATAYDAAYDIWFDPSSNPGNRASQYELMVWLNWKGTQPIAQSYDGSGNAVPYAKNVNVGGATFNVYRRGNVFSFLLASKSNSINFKIQPLAQYCVNQGWMSSSVYLIGIETGWEIIKGGTYQTTAYSVSGL